MRWPIVCFSTGASYSPGLLPDEEQGPNIYDVKDLRMHVRSEWKIGAGVLSHPKSKYLASDTFRSNLAELNSLSDDYNAVVHSKDHFEANDVKLWHTLLRPFVVAFFEFQIRQSRRRSVTFSLYSVLKQVYWALRLGFGPKARKFLLRNRNITAAHQELWRSGLVMDLDWFGIFEDDLVFDARPIRPALEKAVVAAASLTKHSLPTAIFLSESFSVEEHQLLPAHLESSNSDDWSFIYSNFFGWSDTAAATVYSRTFLEILDYEFGRFSELVLYSLPVDVLLEVAMIRSFRSRSPIMTFHLRPGICRQLSLLETHPQSSRSGPGD